MAKKRSRLGPAPVDPMAESSDADTQDEVQAVDEPEAEESGVEVQETEEETTVEIIPEALPPFDATVEREHTPRLVQKHDARSISLRAVSIPPKTND